MMAGISKDDSDAYREKVAARIVRQFEGERRPAGFIKGAVHDGLLSGLRRVRDALRVKRLMREDALRLSAHADELVEWDVGDDGATAAEIRAIAGRIATRYGLSIDI